MPPLAPVNPESSEELTDAERAALAELDERTMDGSGYSVVQATRPQTIGFAPNDSPGRRFSWAARRFVDIRYWGEPARAGHFDGWEQPEVFVDEISAGFRAIASGSDRPAARP